MISDQKPMRQHRWTKRVEPRLNRSLTYMKNAGTTMNLSVRAADTFHVRYN